MKPSSRASGSPCASEEFIDIESVWSGGSIFAARAPSRKSLEFAGLSMRSHGLRQLTYATSTRARRHWSMPQLWYRFLLRAITLIYYRRVRVVRLAAFSTGTEPTLFVGLHRNGAVDGMLYKRAFPRTVFLIARQLLRSWFARIFFTGIPVARSQDTADAASRRENPESMAHAVDHLVSGGQLFVLPEGTSDLGPRHLPFKPGAARILAATIDRGVTPRVIPVGIFYESA